MYNVIHFRSIYRCFIFVFTKCYNIDVFPCTADKGETNPGFHTEFETKTPPENGEKQVENDSSLATSLEEVKVEETTEPIDNRTM